MLLGEAVQHRRFEVEHAQHLLLVDERHHQLGAGLGDEVEIPGVLAHVADHDRLPAGYGGPGQPLPHLDARLLGRDGVGHRLAHHELVRLFVEEQDPEHLVVDHALDHFRHPLEQLVEVEDGGRLLADLVEGGEQPRVPAGLAVEGGVLDGDGEVAGEDLKRRAGIGGEGARIGPLDVQHADEVVAVEERDGHLRHHPRDQGQIAAVLAHVGDEDGLPALGGGAHDALAGPDAQPGGSLGRIAVDEGRNEAAVLVGEEDVQELVVDDPPELAGDRGQERVGIEDRPDLSDDGKQLGEQGPRQQRRLLDRLGAAQD